MPSHIGLSGHDHWSYDSTKNTPETCKQCKAYAKRHANDVQLTQEAYDALDDVIVGYPELKKIGKLVRTIAKFNIGDVSRHYTPFVFGKGPLPFTALKVVSASGGSSHGGAFDFSLPKNGKPGEWAELPDSLNAELCARGFHFTDIRFLPNWAENQGMRVFRAETEGPWAGGQDKFITRKIRLIEELDRKELLEMAGQIADPNSLPRVTDEEAVARIEELEIRVWYPELITGTDPLVLAARAAADARDADAYRQAMDAIHLEGQVIGLEMSIANLRGLPTNVLVRRAQALVIPSGVHISNYDLNGQINKIAEDRYDDRMLQRLEVQRLAQLLSLTKTQIAIEKAQNRDDEPVLLELAKRNIIPANPNWR